MMILYAVPQEMTTRMKREEEKVTKDGFRHLLKKNVHT